MLRSLLNPCTSELAASRETSFVLDEPSPQAASVPKLKVVSAKVQSSFFIPLTIASADGWVLDDLGDLVESFLLGDVECTVIDICRKIR